MNKNNKIQIIKKMNYLLKKKMVIYNLKEMPLVINDDNINDVDE